MQTSVTYFELQTLIFLIIIGMILISLKYFTDPNQKESKLKLWNRMIVNYEGIQLSIDEEQLLKQTFKNTLKNRRVVINPSIPRQIKTTKRVSFSNLDDQL
ncbi:unnamed protein product (macronuclear) [Paramecium tetraurelia]|uniref:Uncharacterized protein n=1 Tax=Paramecium tetraurelia TaxID=5888 RepID=A0CJT0_PARTE|nr:uncharacterized protein GSPATT00000759001 [Paramecium tetraurelia]CAK71047.1 unnamed protein product [Paramecium tetraurelia]|eukprot:XP_001438444.1 hypothetical protein (macronuclear) [Paramecium tetraurelia strain d4-2]